MTKNAGHSRFRYQLHGYRRALLSLTGLALLLGSVSARAEGTDLVGTTQPLRAGTELGVDIIDPAVESIVWTGRGSVEVYGPSGTHLGTATSGTPISPTEGAGAYRLTVKQDQNVGSSWDVAVLGQTDNKGRLFSKDWQFNAGSYAASTATNASFYALVPSGQSTNLSVIELKLQGLAGYIYDINANQRGVQGTNGGRSVPQSGNTVATGYQMYLRVPALANFEAATAGVSNMSYMGGVSSDVFGNSMTPCNQLLPGNSQGYFYFTSTVDGSFQLQCDLDHDGTFSIGSGQDLLITGAASSGTNVVPWDGTQNSANVSTGDYECRVRVTVGEFHYVGTDIETSYPGMRIFRVNADGTRQGLPMYWNDSLVQSLDINMPNGVKGLESSEGTILPGLYSDTVVANVNARSWGNFSGGGKGNNSYLDTFVWLNEATSSSVHVLAADTTDTDGDGLTNYQESCLVGSSPMIPDTDGDGMPDGQQYAVPNSTAFAGLESNGRMSTALAIRAIRRTRVSANPSTAPMSGSEGVRSSTSALVERSQLETWIPTQFEDSSAVNDTPTDLTNITNASGVFGSDYITSDGRRRGGVLLVSAVGSFYEHQKAICDRVHGAKLLDVHALAFKGVTVFESTVSSSDKGRLEYGLSIHLWQNAQSGKWVPASFWIKEDAPSVPSDADVVTLQAWGDSPEFARNLIGAILEQIEKNESIAWPAPTELVNDADYVMSAAPVQPAIEGPTALVQNASTFGGRIELAMRRVSGSGAVRLRLNILAEDGTTTSMNEFPADAPPVAVLNSLTQTPFIEATIDVLDGRKVVDRVWVSDGSWAPFDDSIWTGDSAAEEFSRTDCQNRDFASSDRAKAWNLPSDTTLIHLAGCAKRSIAGVHSFGGVARTLINPLDATNFDALVYWARSDQYDVCLEGAIGSTCVSMPANAGGWESVPTTSFGAEASATELVTFSTTSKTAGIEISGLNWLKGNVAPDSRHDAPDSGSCALAQGQSPFGRSFALLLLGALAWFRTRRSARKDSLARG
jgi:hypothetical protein